jgi:hypothetical protein
MMNLKPVAWPQTDSATGKVRYMPGIVHHDTNATISWCPIAMESEARAMNTARMMLTEMQRKGGLK